MTPNKMQLIIIITDRRIMICVHTSQLFFTPILFPHAVKNNEKNPKKMKPVKDS